MVCGTDPSPWGVTGRANEIRSTFCSSVELEAARERTPATVLGSLVVLSYTLMAKRILADLPQSGGSSAPGRSDGQMILAVPVLNAAGLDRVLDIDGPGADAGLFTLVRRFGPALLGFLQRAPLRGRLKISELG